MKVLALLMVCVTVLAITQTTTAENAEVVESHGQAAWQIQNENTQLVLTQTGGHMAPVTFFRDSDKPITPYYVSPWQDESRSLDVPVLVPLRGDFFCMPFGGNADAFRGEQHPPHGETAGSEWQHKSLTRANGVTTLAVTLNTKVRTGTVTKRLSLVDGQNAIYTEHTIEGFAGPTSIGHHATLQMPERPGAFRIATSAFRFGMTNPTQFSDPKNGEYQSLAIGHRFSSLQKVAQIFDDTPAADLTVLPARKGFADLVQIVSLSSSRLNTPAWTTATNREAGYLWFSLKDPDQLPSTVFWIENHGRHGAPWDGRNNCLGLEEVCAYFADGIVPSVNENLLTDAGVKTSISLRKDRPTRIRTIQGVAKVSPKFDVVKTVKFGKGTVTFVSATGERVKVLVNHSFLNTGSIR